MKENILRITGILLVIIGILFNEYIFALLFSADGVIKSLSLRLRILGLEILFIVTGIFLIHYRRTMSFQRKKTFLVCIGLWFIISGIIMNEWSLRLYSVSAQITLWICNGILIIIGLSIIRFRNHIRLSLPKNPMLVVVSTLITCSLCEFITRAYYSEPILHFINYRGEIRNLYKLGLPAQFDALLGWIPIPGYSNNQNIWHTNVTILENGIRSNDNNLILDEDFPILAVGDSFTFGDQVSNYETWPSILERLLKKRVLNAGVFGYGTDQAFLRAQTLLPIYHPEILVFSLIPDDIIRSEFAEAVGVNKPYFTIENHKLLLRNTPVKKVIEKKENSIDRLLGYSYLMHILMMKLSPGWWIQGGEWKNPTGYRGEDITGLIFQELEILAKAYAIKQVYILIQDSSPPRSDLYNKVDLALNCIDKSSLLHIIDLRDRLATIRIHDIDRYNSFFHGHMSYTGNYFVAETLFNSMRSK